MYLHVDEVCDVEQLEEPQQRQDDAQGVVLALAAVHGVVGGQQQVHRALGQHTQRQHETSGATPSEDGGRSERTWSLKKTNQEAHIRKTKGMKTRTIECRNRMHNSICTKERRHEQNASGQPGEDRFNRPRGGVAQACVLTRAFQLTEAMVWLYWATTERRRVFRSCQLRMRTTKMRKTTTQPPPKHDRTALQNSSVDMVYSACTHTRGHADRCACVITGACTALSTLSVSLDRP